MARKKKVEKVIKLQIEAGKANPAPPVGPALGAAGVNIMDFCKQFNAASQSEKGNILPVEIEVYSDRSFTFKLKKPPMARLLLKEAGIDKGSAEPNKDKVAKITPEQVKKVVAIKMVDLNARTPEAAFNIAAGTARSMGIEVEEA